MNFAKLSAPLGLALVSALAGSIAMAADAGWYAGGNFGRSRTQIDDHKVVNNPLNAGVTSTNLSVDDHDTGFKVFGGYQFNRFFALEAGYFDLGKFSYTADTMPAGTLNGNVKVEGLNFDAVGFLPFDSKLSAFARAGMSYADVNSTFTGTGAANSSYSSRSNTNYKAGLGLQYAFTESLAMRIEGERYRINDASGSHGNVNLASLGLIYRFGGETPARIQQAAAPVYVAPAPEPTPAPQVASVAPPAPQRAAVAPTRRKVVFTSDSFFAFDSVGLTLFSKQTLDTFTTDLIGTEYGMITITGHTDRIGTHEYNKDLSVRRAEEVKVYLMQSSAIPAEKIAVRGVEETEPVTLPNECADEKTRKELIICLQPDRRVEVEVDAVKITR